MKAVRFEVANELIAQALKLPASATIESITVGDASRYTSTFVVSDYSIPEAPEPQECMPICTKERVTWNWNIAS